MDIYGIKNVKDADLEFSYDKYYREIALKLKNIEVEEERNKTRKEKQEILSSFNDIKIDFEELKKNFIKMILDEKSSKYLWILYSKYKDNENYIDKISDILKKENSIIRGGTNTYKMNGWMAHTLYVYQIINYNIANNIELFNFNGMLENKVQIKELNKLYNELDETSKFILKIFAITHDIGVIEDIKYHPELGVKYVEKVLEEIGLTENELAKNNIKISLQDLIMLLKVIIRYHILITSLSTEASDKYVENAYRDLINHIPNIDKVKNNIPKILLIFAYADIIAVDESLMDTGKYNRITEGYYFFEAVTQNKIPIRDKEKVAIERICDTVGRVTYQEVKNKLETILEKYNIKKDIFIRDMYNIKNMRYTGPLMKTLNNLEMTIRIYYELFQLINEFENEESIKDYTIIFVPDKHESYFVEEFINGNFFKCIRLMKETKKDTTIYENIKIDRGIDTDGKYLHISII